MLSARVLVLSGDRATRGIYIYLLTAPLFFYFSEDYKPTQQKGTDELHSASFSRYKGLINRISYIAYSVSTKDKLQGNFRILTETFVYKLTRPY